MSKASEGGEALPTPLVATMYERWTLDYIIELVQAIAMDFVHRPRQYRDVPPEISGILQDFRFRTGTDPYLANRMQRSMTFEAILGSSDGVGIVTDPMSLAPGTGAEMSPSAEGAQCKMTSERLRERARAYTERQVTQGERQLIQAFLDEAVTLKSYLRPIDNENNVVIIGNNQTQAIFDQAVQVLKNEKVATRFGRVPASANNWPLGGSVDDNGSLLIQEIGKVLIHDMMPPTKLMVISQNNFTVMQRIANYGSLTIGGVLQEELDQRSRDTLDELKNRFEGLIGFAYSWKTALDNLTTAM